jgi:hypothetical protein
MFRERRRIETSGVARAPAIENPTRESCFHFGVGPFVHDFVRFLSQHRSPIQMRKLE